MLRFTQGARTWTLSSSSGQFSATDFRQEKIVTLIVYISARGCVQHMYDKVMLNLDKRVHLTQASRESLSTSAAMHMLIRTSHFLCFGLLLSWISINVIIQPCLVLAWVSDELTAASGLQAKQEKLSWTSQLHDRCNMHVNFDFV